MFVGHGLLAFAVAASVATALGWPRNRTLAVGLLAFGFGTLPDVDVLHAVVVLAMQPTGLGDVPGTFWAASTEMHRGVTHSLVVGGLAALGFGAWARAAELRGSSESRSTLAGTLAIAILSSLVLIVAVTSGGLAAVVLALMAVGGIVLSTLAFRSGLGHRPVALAALLGLLTHPFGDLFTGEPPQFLYPFETTVVAERVLLHPDPTLHLVAAFLLELGTIWLAVIVVARLYDFRVLPHVNPRAGLGVGYAGAILAIPSPTVDAAAAFVFSVLAVAAVALPVRRSRGRPVRWQILTTALSAVTVATVAYGGAYLLT